jgi:murein L,D-transpeptidase YafK
MKKRLLFAVLTSILTVSCYAEDSVDRVLVFKKQHKLMLMSGDTVLKTYSVALSHNIGPKQHEGDHKTPEGLYRIDYRKRASSFHRALHISYPNADDLTRATAIGVDPGGSIMIHGLPNGQGSIGSAHHWVDWTDGCIAVTDQEIEEIWNLVPDGTAVEIRP